MSDTRIYIIGTGISAADLSSRALKIINRAEVLIGGKRQLGCFQQHPGLKIEIKRNINELIKTIKKKHNKNRIAVLASGDPNFFGIASFAGIMA